jgi:RNA 3'-terminal phosphate cyclase (ATP)
MMIYIDGSVGEGGGQILRTSLTLSMITGQPFEMSNIRAQRSKPGILRQHLVAVRAAAEVCGANVSGDELGSTMLRFEPASLKGGNFSFDIGSAGSCTLVLQTLIPALMFAKKESSVRISGGTHNPMAPPFEALQRSYQRLLTMMGAEINISLERFGFYPAGGGEITAIVKSIGELKTLALQERGKLISKKVESIIASVPDSVAQKELDHVQRETQWDDSTFEIKRVTRSHGPGNALIATLEYENVTEVFWCPGQKRVSSKDVAETVCDLIRQYASEEPAALGEHLADQAMLPMALAGGGSFTTTLFSDHSMTNANVIEKFLPVKIALETKAGKNICSITKIG